MGRSDSYGVVPTVCNISEINSELKRGIRRVLLDISFGLSESFCYIPLLVYMATVNYLLILLTPDKI
jgi:type II secretory pathway component PulF